MNTVLLRRLHTLAAHHSLGEPLACIVHPPQPISRLSILAILIGLVLLVALAQLAPFLSTLLPLWQVLLILLLALLWMAVGLWLLVASIMPPARIVSLLCTGGIVWSYRRSLKVIRWPEVESLWRKTTHGSAIRYEIRRRDGRVVTLDSRVPGAEKLARFVEQVIISRHLAWLLSEYAHGVTLKFGPLCISLQGLQVSSQHGVLLWQQVKYIRNIEGMLIIRQKQQVGEWATIPLATIPNVCLLGAMMHAIHALHRTQAPMLERSA